MKAASTVNTVNTAAQPVCAPAYKFSAERVNDVLVLKPPEKAEASLASPWPIRS